MAKSFPLDTDVLVDFFRGHSRAVAFVNAQSGRIILSSIVVAELYAGVKGESEQALLDSFISFGLSLPGVFWFDEDSTETEQQRGES